MDSGNATQSVITSIIGTANYANLPPQLDYVVQTLVNVSVWQVLGTVVALAVAYDQSMLKLSIDLRENCCNSNLCSYS